MNLITLKLFRSFENRKLLALKIGTSPLGTKTRAVWIDGGIHARQRKLGLSGQMGGSMSGIQQRKLGLCGQIGASMPGRGNQGCVDIWEHPCQVEGTRAVWIDGGIHARQRELGLSGQMGASMRCTMYSTVQETRFGRYFYANTSIGKCVLYFKNQG